MLPLRPPALLMDRNPPELLVSDEDDACPYLDGRTARFPLRLPVRALRGAEFDERLQQGDRRHGQILYRPTCPSCVACEAIRIPVDQFRPSKTHRRVLRSGDEVLRVEIGDLTVDEERVALYEKHLQGRGLDGPGHPPMTLTRYRGFMGESCCVSFELRVSHEGKLVGVSLTDAGASSLSAHYCCWDPDFAHLSLGTYAILKQIELCSRWGLRHLYLGLFVAQNVSMAYKARYRPHERHIDGAWRKFG